MGIGLELFGRRKDGSEFPVEISLSPLETSEGILVSAVIRDITDRKKAEEELQRAYKEMEQRVAERTAHLKTALDEKEVMLKEIHHRVKNNLQVISSLLNLTSRSLHNKEAADVLQETTNRVRSMAVLHEKLYQSSDLAHIEFLPFARDIVHGLAKFYSDKNVSVDVHSENIFLTADKALPLGFILNELVSNSFKHAFSEGEKGEIQVSLLTDPENKFILTVSDNGKGLSAETDIKEKETLGMQLVHIWVQQLGGMLEVESKKGTKITLVFQN